MLQGKVVIITGAGSGIGRETGILFAQHGARVAVWDMDKETGQETANIIRENSGEAIFCPTDVCNAQEVQNSLEMTLQELGQVDILINNAGITRDGFLTRMEPEDWQKVMEVNLTGVFNCTRAIAEKMMEREEGCIINASSVVGVYGNIGQTNYSATKAGVIGLTRSWAKELGRKGIRVNAVAPGFIATKMTEKVPEKVLDRMKGNTPLGRLGKPEDVAWAYLYLASDHASFVNGAILQVDGGLVL